MNGVLYVTYGEAARREAQRSIEALRRVNDVPIAVIADEPLGIGTRWIEWHEPGEGARWAKVNCDKLTPFDNTLYLDADTRPQTDISTGFEILADGWDMVIVPSGNQGHDLLWHVEDDEREQTIAEVGYEPLQLQGGVFWFGKNTRTEQLFNLWRSEWKRWGDQDQAALLRAYHRSPVKLWLLGFAWNGGACIQHLFGRTR